MENSTRRKLVQGLGLTTVLGLTGCGYSCEDNLADESQPGIRAFERTFVMIFYGQAGSRALGELYAKKDRAAAEKRNLEMPTTSTAISDAASYTALLNIFGNAAGRQSQSTVAKRIDTLRRDSFVTDVLGDSQADGRVLAFEFTAAETGRLRGIVNVQPARGANAPALEWRDLAVSPDGNLLVISQSGTPAQWIFVDPVNLRVGGRLMAPAEVFPRVAVFAPDGRTLYSVASSQQFGRIPPPPHTLQVIDPVQRRITRSVTLPANTEILDAVVSPDGGLLVGVGQANAIHIVDLATLTYSARIPGLNPLGDAQPYSGVMERVLMSPRGDRFFASITRNPSNNFNLRTAAVGVFDVASATKIGEMPLRYPAGVAAPRMGLSPDGRFLVAAFQRGPEAQIFDTETLAEVESIRFPANFGFATLTVG